MTRLVPRLGKAMYPVAPCVRGIVLDEPDGLYVIAVWSDDPGKGRVAAWLDTLPNNRKVVVPLVLSERLATALSNRGFEVERIWAEDEKEWVLAYVRHPQPVEATCG